MLVALKRFVVGSALLAACDSTPPVILDATIDTPGEGLPIDGPPPPLCVPPATGVTTVLTQGLSFTASPATQRAVKAYPVDSSTFDLVGTEGDAFTTSEAAYMVVVPRDPLLTWVQPTLSPGGDQLFLVRYDQGAARLARADRTGPNTWSTPALVTVLDENDVPIAFVGSSPSRPTTTVPRRMVVSNGSTIFELVELNASTWLIERRYTPVFSGLSFFGETSLNEDGRRLVFKAGIPIGGGMFDVTGFYVDRQRLDEQFTGTATAIVPAVPGAWVDRPMLADDCRHYTYSIKDPFSQTGGAIQLVTFP